MPKVRGTSDPEIVTPPTPLPIPSPTYEKEDGERFTAQGEVVTEPRNRYVGDTHAEIPEYEGSYNITENMTLHVAGLKMKQDLVINVAGGGGASYALIDNEFGKTIVFMANYVSLANEYGTTLVI